MESPMTFILTFSTKAIIEVGKSNSYLSFNASADEIYFNETVLFDILLVDEDSVGISDEISVFLNNTKYNHKNHQKLNYFFSGFFHMLF